MVHEEEKPYKCTICNKTFALKYFLMEHISSLHEGEKPYGLCF